MFHKRWISSLVVLHLVQFFFAATAPAATTLATTLSVEERYDSNVFRDARGQESDDVVSTFSPGLSLTIDRRRMQLTGRYTAGITVYAENPSYNTVTHSASLDLKVPLTRKTDLFAGDNFTYTPQVLQVDVLAVQNLQVRFTDILYNNIFVGTERSLTDNVSVGIRADDTVIDFKAPSLVDSRTDALKMQLGYRASPAWTFTPSYRYSRFSFARGDLGTMELHQADLNIIVNPSPSVTLDITGGAASLDGELQWAARAFITRKFRPTTLTAGFSRDFFAASGLASEVNISTVYTLTFASPLTRNLDVNISGSYAENTSRPNSVLDTNSYTAGINGTWRISQRVNIGYGYAHYQQWDRGNTPANNILRDTVYLKFSLDLYSWRF